MQVAPLWSAPQEPSLVGVPVGVAPGATEEETADEALDAADEEPAAAELEEPVLALSPQFPKPLWQPVEQ